MNDITERECESLSDNFFSPHLDLGILKPYKNHTKNGC